MYNGAIMVEAQAQDEERARLLAAASQLLRAGGAQALSVRKVAKAAGCSTMGVYSRFGGKPGLLDALYAEGFALLAAAQGQVQGPPGREHVLALCGVYRAVARTHPAHYALMMGGVAGFEPSAERTQLAARTFAVVRRAIHRAQRINQVAGEDPADLAEAVLASCHGLLTFELSGRCDDPAAAARRYQATVGALLDGWPT